MNMNFSVFFFAVLALADVSIGSEPKLRFEIIPNDHYDSTSKAVQLVCSMKNVRGDNILLMQMFKDNDGAPEYLATLRQNSEAILGRDINGTVKADGKIISGSKKSFLGVTINYPDESNQGDYRCDVSYLDDRQYFKQVSATRKLTWTKISEHKKVAIFKKLLKEAGDLENEVKNFENNGEDILARLTKLEALTQNHQIGLTQLSKQVSTNSVRSKKATNPKNKSTKDLHEKFNGTLFHESLEKNIREVEYRFNQTKKLAGNAADLLHMLASLTKNAIPNEAFTVTTPKDMILVGKPIVFTNFVTREGTGYNPTTGIFVAPRAGVYVFSLVIRLSRMYCGLELELQSSKKHLLAAMSIQNGNVPNQSSTSAVAFLETNQSVQAVVKQIKGVGCDINPFEKEDCYFTGFLAKAL